MTIMDENRGTDSKKKDDSIESNSEDNLKKQIIESIAREKDAFFKFQPLNAEELSSKEKKTIIQELLNSNKSLFIQRYGRFLSADQLLYFQDDHSEDVRIQVKSLQTNIQSKSKLLRNRRYQALQDLLKKSSYFSDSEMQSRNPFLFEQMVGQYMNEQEKRELQSTSYVSNYDRIAFSSFLFEQIRQTQMKMESSIQEQNFQEENDDDDPDEDKEENSQEQITDHEKKLLRDEFRDIMIQNFLNGEDGEHFDYQQVDNNTDFDLSKEFERDQEEKYFDMDDD